MSNHATCQALDRVGELKAADSEEINMAPVFCWSLECGGLQTFRFKWESHHHLSLSISTSLKTCKASHSVPLCYTFLFLSVVCWCSVSLKMMTSLYNLMEWNRGKSVAWESCRTASKSDLALQFCLMMTHTGAHYQSQQLIRTSPICQKSNSRLSRKSHEKHSK